MVIHIRNSVNYSYLITEAIQVLKAHHNYAIDTRPRGVLVSIGVNNLARVVTPPRVIVVNLVAVCIDEKSQHSAFNSC